MKSNKLIILLSTTSLLFANLISGGCGDTKKKKPDDKEVVKKLKAKFQNYDFKDKTPKALIELSKTPAEASTMVAAEKAYLEARTLTDWFLSAWLQGDSRLLRDLFVKLKLPPKCCPQGKKCIEGVELRLSSSCREKLFGKLAAKYAILVDLEGDWGHYKRIGEAGQQLLQALLDLPKLSEKMKRAMLTKAVFKMDPIGNRAALMALVQAGAKVSTVLSSPPHRAGKMMAFAYPYFCSKPMPRVKPTFSPSKLQKVLEGSACSYRCEALKKLPNETVQLHAKVASSCPKEALNVPKKTLRHYFTQNTYLALTTLKHLTAALTRIQKDDTDPLLKLHRAFAIKTGDKLKSLRIPAAYPPALKTASGIVTPPIVPTKKAYPVKAPVHVVMGKLNYYAGVLPVVGLKDDVPTLLEAEAGFPLPGKTATIPQEIQGPISSLQKGLQEAREVANRLLPKAITLGKGKGWVAVYADKNTPVSEVAKLLKTLESLPAPKINAAQILFTSEAKAGATAHAVTLHLGTPPQGSVALPKEPAKSGEALSGAKGLVVKADDETMEKLISRIVAAHQKAPQIPTHLKAN